MPITKEDKILIKNLFALEGYNAKRVSWQRWNECIVYKLLQKTTGYWVVPAVADDAAPTQLITLILFMNTHKNV